MEMIIIPDANNKDMLTDDVHNALQIMEAMFTQSQRFHCFCHKIAENTLIHDSRY